MAKPGVQKHKQKLCPHSQTASVLLPREHTLIIFAKQKVLPHCGGLSAQDLPESCCAGFIHWQLSTKKLGRETEHSLGLREDSGRVSQGPGCREEPRTT